MDFSGKTVVIVGSGPSLTCEDCEAVERSGKPIIAINSSWERVKSANIVFAGDEAWWNNNHDKVNIPAERWTSSASASSRFNLKHFYSDLYHWNSGLRAIELAEKKGAAKVILIGLDCDTAYGKHWHPDHVGSSNPTAKVCKDWQQQFGWYAKKTKMEIVNCSRYSALLCFPRQKLEDALC